MWDKLHKMIDGIFSSRSSNTDLYLNLDDSADTKTAKLIQVVKLDKDSPVKQRWQKMS